MRRFVSFIDTIPVRLRLSLGHAALMGVVLMIAGFGIYRLVEMNLIRSVDATLLATAQSIRNARPASGLDQSLLDSYMRDFLEDHTIHSSAQLVDFSGKVSAKTRNLNVRLPVTRDALQRAEAGLETFESFRVPDSEGIRQITLPVIAYGRFSGELIQVATPIESTRRMLGEIALALWLALPLALGLSIVAGWFLTARSLAAVARMTQAAGQIGMHDLGSRLPLPPAKDEIRLLGETLNNIFDQLEESVTRLRRFAADVSHELRTPLSVLRGEAELALRRERAPADYQQTLHTIADESTHMTRVIEDLLLLARAQARAVDIAIEQMAPRDFIEQVRKVVAAAFEQKNCQFSVEDRLTPAYLRCAPGYLGIAVTNLLLNAAKHNAPGTRVLLRMERSEHHVLITVQDWGRGIAPEILPRVFDPFVRGDSARHRDTDSAGGVGLGLSLARALISLHEGTITVQSSTDVNTSTGTTFLITLPDIDPARKKTEPT